MQKTVPTVDAPTPQEMYDLVTQAVADIEADLVSMDDLVLMLALGKAFMEANFEVE
jgi:hypothetical protein